LLGSAAWLHSEARYVSPVSLALVRLDQPLFNLTSVSYFRLSWPRRALGSDTHAASSFALCFRVRLPCSAFAFLFPLGWPDPCRPLRSGSSRPIRCSTVA